MEDTKVSEDSTMHVAVETSRHGYWRFVQVVGVEGAFTQLPSSASFEEVEEAVTEVLSLLLNNPQLKAIVMSITEV